jgi:ubiquinone biosynthesis protein
MDGLPLGRLIHSIYGRGGKWPDLDWIQNLGLLAVKLGQVGTKIRRGLFEFFAALSEYDYPRCAAALNRMSERELSAEAFDSLKRKFLALYADFKDRTVAQVSLTRKMMQTIKLGVHSGMTFEKGIFAIIRSLMYLDGMVLRCKPDAVRLRDMRRFVVEFEKRL